MSREDIENVKESLEEELLSLQFSLPRAETPNEAKWIREDIEKIKQAIKDLTPA
jgi:uncharacterized protein YcgL (UPF0745 family)